MQQLKGTEMQILTGGPCEFWIKKPLKLLSVVSTTVLWSTTVPHMTPR